MSSMAPRGSTGLSAHGGDGNGLQLISSTYYNGTAVAGGDPQLGIVDDALLTGGGLAGQMLLRPLD